MMAIRHPPMAAIAHDRVSLLEVPVVQQPPKKGTNGSYVNFPVHSDGFLDGIMLVILVLWQLIIAKADAHVSR